MERDQKFLNLLGDWAVAQDAEYNADPERPGYADLVDRKRAATDALLGYVTSLRSEVARLRAVVEAADRLDSDDLIDVIEIAEAEAGEHYGTRARLALHAYRTARAALDAKEG